MKRWAIASDPRTWVDAHLHLWNSSLLAPPWLAQAPHFAGKFDVSRYQREGGAAQSMVLIEADVAVADREREAQLLDAWAQETVVASTREFAIVAAIEPNRVSFASELAAMKRIPRVRGSRRVLHAGEIEFGTRGFAQDMQSLSAQGMSFDFCVRWSDLAKVDQLACELAPMTIIVDHLGNPPIRAGWNSPQAQQWQRLIARVASNGNTCVKWSAMFENAGCALSLAQARPWFEWCLACFGAQRVLWGSNWPVCFAHASLVEWIELSATLAGELTATEQDQILRGAACATYRM
jgi:predicted TIM-barrel fold metal-dependent hydrolase